MKDKRRWLEWGKNLLIAALTLSAVYLLTMTPLVQDSGLLDLLEPQSTGDGGSGPVTLTAAAYPSRMAVSNGSSRYGLQYDQDGVDGLFARMGPLLGEALVTSSQPEPIDETRWQRHLEGESIYFDFSDSIPLSALGSWLHPEGQSGLTASARRVLLAAGEDSGVLLCYQDGETEQFYACQTTLTCALHLHPAVEQVEGNGAIFAFESEELSRLLRPYTMITEELESAVFAAGNSLAGSEDVAALLEALSFNGQNHVSVSGGEAYLDGENRLEVTNSGTVFYRAAQEGKYSVVSAGETATVAEIIEAARELAENTVGVRCGEARLYLASVRETEDGCLVRFGYRLNGSSVWLYDEGWAAEFVVKNEVITEFTLHFRSYAATGARVLMLSAERAAVMLPALTDEPLELVVQYRDRGMAEVSPIWVAE